MPASIVPDLLGMFGDEVDIEHRTGTDAFGKATGYETLFSVRARISQGTQIVRTGGGQDVNTNVQVILAGVFDVTTLDRITLPVRFDPRRPKILHVGWVSDENGPHHEIVYC